MQNSLSVRKKKIDSDTISIELSRKDFHWIQRIQRIKVKFKKNDMVLPYYIIIDN